MLHNPREYASKVWYDQLGNKNKNSSKVSFNDDDGLDIIDFKKGYLGIETQQFLLIWKNLTGKSWKFIWQKYRYNFSKITKYKKYIARAKKFKKTAKESW